MTYPSKLNTVVSLFDGMSCLQIALNKLGIQYDKYYASEIDKFAIQTSTANYPNTIHLGSVVDIDTSLLGRVDLLAGGSPCQSFSFAGKRKGMATKCEVEILTPEHYLELKSEKYEFEGQSYLFWEYMRILTDLRKVNPEILFLLENVEMGSKWEAVLNKAIGIKGIHINSALVSAQNRKRIYWTNIASEQLGLFGWPECTIPQPADKGILLKDVLEVEVDEKYYLSENTIKRLSNINGAGFKSNIKSGDEKGATVFAQQYKISRGMDMVCVASRGRGENNEQTLETNKTNSLTSVTKDNLIMQVNPSLESGGKQPYQQNRIYDTDGIAPSLCANKADLLIVHNTMPRSSKTKKGGTGPLSGTDGKTYCLDTGTTNAIEIGCLKFGRTDEAKEIRKQNMKDGVDYTPFAEKEINGIDFEKMNTVTSTATKDNLLGEIEVTPCDYRLDEGLRVKRDGKTGTLAARGREDESCGQLTIVNTRIRRLTPLECKRLQTVPDDYLMPVSESQQYKMLGNGWTIDVIAHILSHINKSN